MFLFCMTCTISGISVHRKLMLNCVVKIWPHSKCVGVWSQSPGSYKDIRNLTYKTFYTAILSFPWVYEGLQRDYIDPCLS